MWANWKIVVAGVLLVLGPVGLRVFTWKSPTKLEESSAADVAAGRELFVHEWKKDDPLCEGGDGLGPVFNATSCAACHHLGGLGGSGGLEHNVTTFVRRPDFRTNTPLQGVVHSFAIESRYLESLRMISSELPNISRPSLATLRENSNRGMVSCRLPGSGEAVVSQRNTPALFGSRLIDSISDRVIIAEERRQRLRWGMVGPKSEDAPVGRALRLKGGRIGKFGWKAQSASLSDFVQAACANELGLSNPGAAQPIPLGFPSYVHKKGYDLTRKQCDQITAFCGSLPQPVEQLPTDVKERDQAEAGKKLFTSVGCASCHTPKLGSVDGVYSDLLLHRMGRELTGDGDYNEPPRRRQNEEDEDPKQTGPLPDEWRTPPLWGVADSAPYLHDGRAATLKEAITEHGGQATSSRNRFNTLAPQQQDQLLAFLKTLRAPAQKP
jgi:CxxC motif-containing protein (DUF1111 family)